MIRKHLLSSLPLAMLAMLALAGCGGTLFESKKIDYKSAGKLPSLEIPPDLTTPSRDDRYSVPDISAKSTATFSAYSGERAGQGRASGSSEVLPKLDKARLERAGSQRWLVVNGAPDKLWPAIKEFWQETGFIVNLELPEAGIMETDWAENRAKLPQGFLRSQLSKVLDSLYSTPERDKFRTRLEKGMEAGTTEIYISHRGMNELYINEGKTETRWQPTPANPELEAEMLGRLMVRLGSTEEQAKALFADDTKTQRAKLTKTADGSDSLELQEAFDRSWRRVGLVLDRVGFTVEDRDRVQGMYFVRYVDPEIDNSKKEDQSFLSKLAFWNTKKDPSQLPQFRIYVKGNADVSTVQVMTREGGVDKSDTAKKILGLLLDQLK
ncbi:MAG: outer membrane protein assembly factor BamC [Proteobacteria bacterium]|nr:outer membrane protein assembly factor BamC [Pseudomonadota bacterium]